MSSLIISVGVLVALVCVAANYLRKRPECRAKDEKLNERIKDWGKRHE
jgi:hypothetical protein